MREISDFENLTFDGVPYSFSSPGRYNSVEGGGETGDPFNNQQKNQRWLSDCEIINDLYLDVVSPPFQFSHEELRKLAGILEPLPAKSERIEPFVEISSPLGILKDFKSGLKRVEENCIKFSSSHADYEIHQKGGKKLSMGDILRLAGEKFIKSFSKGVNDLSLPSHPFGMSFLDLSKDEKLAVLLVENLLASAEKISQQRYKSACKILSRCKNSASETGNPVQRLAYYFSEALQEKIDRETGKVELRDIGKKTQFNMDKEMMSPNPTIIAHHKQMPYSQISFYTAVQTIIENVAVAKKVHVVDLEIRSGLQYAVLMQALAVRYENPIELLKITAVGTRSKETIEKTGEWLTNLSQSMNLPFSFNVVMVPDILHLKPEAFEIHDGETMAVYSSFFLRTLIAKQDTLEHLMRLLADMNPCILVVTEVEANHTSPAFVTRFVESLFFFGAYFDCLGDCMDLDDPHRKMTESMYFGEGIRNIVAAESNERTTRHANISAWRSFYAGFGMNEEKLSTASLFQASLLVKNFPCWRSCSLATDKKCLTVGWKGTPLVSISAWKFV